MSLFHFLIIVATAALIFGGRKIPEVMDRSNRR